MTLAMLLTPGFPDGAQVFVNLVFDQGILPIVMRLVADTDPAAATGRFHFFGHAFATAQDYGVVCLIAH